MGPGKSIINDNGSLTVLIGPGSPKVALGVEFFDVLGILLKLVFFYFLFFRGSFFLRLNLLLNLFAALSPTILGGFLQCDILGQ